MYHTYSLRQMVVLSGDELEELPKQTLHFGNAQLQVVQARSERPPGRTEREEPPSSTYVPHV